MSLLIYERGAQNKNKFFFELLIKGNKKVNFVLINCKKAECEGDKGKLRGFEKEERKEISFIR